MFINLRCSSCNETSPIHYGRLYSIWKQGYDQMPEEKKAEIYITAEINCECGHSEKFESPMFRYIFDVVFHELMSLENE